LLRPLFEYATDLCVKEEEEEEEEEDEVYKELEDEDEGEGVDEMLFFCKDTVIDENNKCLCCCRADLAVIEAAWPT